MRGLYPGQRSAGFKPVLAGQNRSNRQRQTGRLAVSDRADDAEEFIPLPDTNKVSRYPVAPAEIIRDGTAHLPSAR
jgi:hypothetical protein